MLKKFVIIGENNSTSFTSARSQSSFVLAIVEHYCGFHRFIALVWVLAIDASRVFGHEHSSYQTDHLANLFALSFSVSFSDLTESRFRSCNHNLQPDESSLTTTISSLWMSFSGLWASIGSFWASISSPRSCTKSLGTSLSAPIQLNWETSSRMTGIEHYSR